MNLLRQYIMLTSTRKAGREKTALWLISEGGTLDIVVAHVTEESINELFIDGDLNLGGSDWDAAFREYIRKEYLAGKQLEIDEEQELIIKTEMAKKRLSDKTETKFSISTCEGRFEISLTRNEFEKCTAGLLDRVRTRAGEKCAR